MHSKFILKSDPQFIPYTRLKVNIENIACLNSLYDL